MSLFPVPAPPAITGRRSGALQLIRTISLRPLAITPAAAASTLAGIQAAASKPVRGSIRHSCERHIAAHAAPTVRIALSREHTHD